MKQIKLILILSIVYCLLSIVYCFAAGEDVTVSGDTKAQTVSLENAALPASGSEGEIRYDNTTQKLYVWDGAGWELLSANKNVATKIVGVRRNPPNTALDSLDADRADYICNGVDDQQEINQAIIDVIYSADRPGITVAKQGVVYLLDGTYNISNNVSFAYTRPDTGGTITLTTSGIVINPTAVAQSGISLIGTGTGTALKLASGTSSVNVINASSVSRTLISQLMVDGNSNTGDNNYGIYFSSVTYSKIDKVWVEQMDGYGIYLGSSSNNNTLSGNNVQGSSFYGIYLYSSSNNNTLSGNIIQDNGYYGICLESSSNNNTLSGNNVQGNNDYGILLGSSSNNNTLSGNNVQGSRWMGISLASSSNNTLSGNNVQGGIRWGIYLASSSNNILSGNNVQGNSRDGISLVASSNNTLSGNTIYNNGGSSGAYDGIEIQSGSDTNLISSNRISATKGPPGSNWAYMINIATNDCDNNYIVGNELSLPATYTGNLGKISDSGTGTKYTGKEKITLERARDTTSASIDSNQSYVKLGFTNRSVIIDNGKSSGDILILEGPGIGLVTPVGTNLKLCALHGPPHSLGVNDTLTLIWNGSYWLELSYTNN